MNCCFLGKKVPHMTTKEELKVDKTRDYWRKLNTQNVGVDTNQFGKAISIQYC